MLCLFEHIAHVNLAGLPPGLAGGSWA